MALPCWREGWKGSFSTLWVDYLCMVLVSYRIEHMSAVCVNNWLGKVCRDFQEYLTDAAAGLEAQQCSLQELAKGWLANPTSIEQYNMLYPRY